MDGDSLSIREVAARLGVHRSAVGRWIDDGLLGARADLRPGALRRPRKYVLVADLDDFLTRWQIVAGPVRKNLRPIVWAKAPKHKMPRASTAARPYTSAFITQAEAARILGIDQTSVSNWAKWGIIPTEQSPAPASRSGTIRRIPREAFLSLVASDGFVRPRIGRPL